MTEKKLKVAAGHYHLFHRVAPTVAKAKGYFAEEGLEVDISATGADLKSLQALNQGEIDIVVDLKTPVALPARDRGMWEEEYPLIPAIPSDGSVNVAGLEVILREEQ